MNRVEILDLSIPAYLEAVPKFRELLGAMDGLDGRPTIESALEDISVALRQLPASTDLWDWPDLKVPLIAAAIHRTEWP